MKINIELISNLGILMLQRTYTVSYTLRPSFHRNDFYFIVIIIKDVIKSIMSRGVSPSDANQITFILAHIRNLSIWLDKPSEEFHLPLSSLLFDILFKDNVRLFMR